MRIRKEHVIDIMIFLICFALTVVTLLFFYPKYRESRAEVVHRKVLAAVSTVSGIPEGINAKDLRQEYAREASALISEKEQFMGLTNQAADADKDELWRAIIRMSETQSPDPEYCVIVSDDIDILHCWDRIPNTD